MFVIYHIIYLAAYPSIGLLNFITTFQTANILGTGSHKLKIMIQGSVHQPLRNLYNL